eukprot:GHVT01040380.1.p1 GENE.GHVT01040380.1~~GHVT01040380.1.p1  ORF type:complete len:416 (+),score=109.47 GHVT01040380.1:397-1644(+)
MEIRAAALEVSAPSKWDGWASGPLLLPFSSPEPLDGGDDDEDFATRPFERCRGNAAGGGAGAVGGSRKIDSALQAQPKQLAEEPGQRREPLERRKFEVTRKDGTTCEVAAISSFWVDGGIPSSSLDSSSTCSSSSSTSSSSSPSRPRLVPSLCFAPFLPSDNFPASSLVCDEVAEAQGGLRSLGDRTLFIVGLNNSLRFLLHCRLHVFWSFFLWESSLVEFLDSFLLNATKPLAVLARGGDAVPAANKKAGAGSISARARLMLGRGSRQEEEEEEEERAQEEHLYFAQAGGDVGTRACKELCRHTRELFHLVFLVLYRLSISSEGPEDFLEFKTHEKFIQTSKLFTFGNLVNICQLYGPCNPSQVDGLGARLLPLLRPLDAPLRVFVTALQTVSRPGPTCWRSFTRRTSSTSKSP